MPIGLAGEESVDAGSSLLITTLGTGPIARVELLGEDQANVDATAALVENDPDAE